jgi:hypothetical protein
MGGGSSSEKFDPEALKRIEAKARDILRQGEAESRRNVFLSFAHEDLSLVNLLRGQIKNPSTDLEANDWSVQSPYDSQEADYIRRRIRERIRHSSAVICIVSEATSSSRWVNWEISEALQLDKRVACVYSGDSPPRSLPTAARDGRVQVLPWNHETISSWLESND